MSHKKIYSLIVCAVFLLISICLISCSHINTTSDTGDTNAEVVQIVKIENVDDFFAIENGFVHFGKENCSSCRAFYPILSEVAHDENITIYYFDTGYFRKNALLAESELQAIFSDYQILSVPIIIELRNGQTCNTFFPKFNKQRDNTAEVKESIKNFLLQEQQE